MPKNSNETDLFKDSDQKEKIKKEEEYVSLSKFFHLSKEAGKHSTYIKESFKKFIKDKSYKTVDTWNELFKDFINSPVEV